MINVAKEMEHLHTLAVNNPALRFPRLWDKISTEPWLTSAWAALRPHPGSQTPGIDHIIAADVDSSRIRHLAQRLHVGSYRPHAVRRVYIPKRNGTLRPLGIPTIDDRLVQQALRMALEPIFEADFLPCSHGFRQGHSPHTALRQVACMYPRVSWVIEGDIVGCFDNIPHNGLLKALARRIADGKVLSLVAAFLHAGYLENWHYHTTYSGTPQGGVLSPLLCNVFLHQLDVYMEHLGANRGQTNPEKVARRSPAYERLQRRITKLGGQFRAAPTRQERTRLLQELLELKRQRHAIPVYSTRHQTKLGYVRYADDFVILVNGTREEASALKQQVEGHLGTLGLQLSADKTHITHWDQPITFLGYHIHGILRERGVQIHAVFSIPRDKERLLCRELLHVARAYHTPELDAMLAMNAKFRGWCNYYKYAHNPQEVFNRIAHKMWWYYAHFLAHKYHMRIKPLLMWARQTGQYKTVQKGQARRLTFIECVGKKDYVLDVFPPHTATIFAVSTTTRGETDVKPGTLAHWRDGRSTATRLTALARSAGICERCGVHPAQQVHHPNRMHTKKTLRAKVMSDKDQQPHAVALCQECHLGSHHGNYGQG